MTDSALPVAPARDVWRFAGSLVRSRRRSVLLVVALLVLATGAGALIPAIIGRTVDLAIDDGSDGELLTLVIAMAVVALVGGLALMVGRYRAARVGESMLDELRTSVYDSIMSLPGSVVERVGTGELVARGTGDVEILAQASRGSIPTILVGLILGILLTVGLFVADPRLAVAGIVSGVATGFLGVRWYLRVAPERYQREREVAGERSAAVLEHYTGRRSLWSFGAVGVAEETLERAGQRVYDATMASTAARNRLRPALRMGQGVALAVVIALGAWFVDQGSLAPGALTAAALYTLRLIDPLSMLLEEIERAQQARAALGRIVGLVDLQREHAAATAPRRAAGSTPDGSMSVDLTGVSFGYDEHPVLVDVDLAVPAGATAMIVGPSGAGKSTLAGLVTGIHDPWTGSIEIGGVAVSSIPDDELRQVVALIAQETHVFARTIRENVTLARPDATDAEVRGALEAAGAWAWIEDLPDGVGTVVESATSVLTSARAQQINLARIICADPAVVVLDEAMADLDPVAAAGVEERLAVALRGRTVLRIAHRLDSAPDADLVVMVDNGAIVEVGHHDRLLDARGSYRRLWDTWSASRDR
ncbi:MAG: ABC transporter ATP-binding protein [Actinomycetota bacterium]